MAKDPVRETTAEVINALPRIRTRTYLELGVRDRHTFDAVRCIVKHGVDCEPTVNCDFKLTTDEFFRRGVGLLHYDVIYIDANHDFEQVCRDYDNAVTRLTPRGIILMHDLVPPDETYTHVGWCSDAWRWLYGRIVTLQTAGLFVQGATDFRDANFGLTLVVHPEATITDIEKIQATFGTFEKLLQRIPQHSLAEMQTIARDLP